jgi:hypothetical protein
LAGAAGKAARRHPFSSSVNPSLTTDRRLHRDLRTFSEPGQRNSENVLSKAYAKPFFLQ